MQWKSANVLFADVKGYSSLTDEQMKTFATEILRDIGERISRLQMIDRNTWGDGIVLLSERIGDLCEAALAMRETFRGMNWGRYNLPRLEIRISIHHGEYLSGIDPFTQRPAFCGRTIVTAARLEPVTPPGWIWMTEDAATALKRHIQSERQANKAEFFAVADLGDVKLPKNYGSIRIACLRRYDDPALSESDLQRIRDMERLRQQPDPMELAKTISSFYIVVGVVVSDGRVLMVRRHENTERLDWMFPSAKKWPTADAEITIEKEVREETGLDCGEPTLITQVERHPVTGFKCAYYRLQPLPGRTISNGDPSENRAVEWVPIETCFERLGAQLNSDVRAYLDRARMA
jgi:class 3 adenylate cyclase/8-oxo-dGTP pyrophosphatase MutT (NUDIX family)